MSDDITVRTNKGLINDVQANLLAICLEAFNKEPLEYVEQPVDTRACNPDDVNVKDLPALYAWVDGFQPSSDSIGQNTTRKLTQKLKFHANVQYMRPHIDSEQDAEQLNEVAWFLFEHIRKNLNLNDLVKTETIIPEVTLMPMLRRVQGKLQPVSNVNIKLVFTLMEKKRMSTRASKYL